MATLALSVAGQFAGGLLGGPLGATMGRALGALAGSAVDSVLFGDTPQASAGTDIRLQGSSEGGAIPRLYGWGRLSGNIIWATELEEFTLENTGAKGMAQVEQRGVAASFAVALCEGEVHRLGRIWADAQVLETEGLSIRFYRGTEDQLPDSLMEAKQGAGATPAYRGLCYIVFERLPLGQFGNRIPQISVELCRVVGDLEPAIRAVAVIPGATEFGYDPTPRVRLMGPGRTEAENTHLSSSVSDWTLSLDELQALCPNLKHVALVVAWFGDDLRCSQCSIRPKVESATRTIEGVDWSVAGLTRATAQVVSSSEGSPAYGGTPSDSAVLAAITDLKARGIRVTLYPLVMMDIPAGNALPDPYTGDAGQPAYAWRGRITSSPAPGVAGTPDKTAAIDTQVEAFMGAPDGWGLRRMILHYAGLAAQAGGVDALLIGSELRGLTTLRGAEDSFSFVTSLTGLAAEVRMVVGPDTKLTYAADWSEYSGYQPADEPGAKFFHLDPLWASPDIDAVGIDNYMPLSDWREGTDHADAGVAGAPYGLDYLKGNIAGGEGYDWYYASEGDRIAGTRTPITDGQGEPWIWRYKDLVSWWSEPHHNRPGGVRDASATAWLPKTKPIWFTELGCGAVDKGANQPNVFGDEKSSEDARPYFSSGAPDGLIQRQFLRAHLGTWVADTSNPAANLYAGRMLDLERIYLWAWDARPYPAFPAQVESWADGVNHATGHWLTGRLGSAASDELIRAVADDYGIDAVTVSSRPPLLHGMLVEGVVSARDALGGTSAALGLSVRDGVDGLIFAGPATGVVQLNSDELAEGEGALVTRRTGDPAERIGRLSFAYLDRERDYLNGSVTALRLAEGAAAAERSALVLDQPGARMAAERLLAEHGTEGDSIEFALPPSQAEVEVGDTIAIAEGTGGPYQVTAIRGGLYRRISAKALAPDAPVVVSTQRPSPIRRAHPARSLPVLALAQLPGTPDAALQSRLLTGAYADPWPGWVAVEDAATGAQLVRLSQRAVIGELTTSLGAGPTSVWDRGSVLEISLYGGHFASAAEGAALAGSNRLAIQNDSGDWELVGFRDALMTGAGTYRITHLLRGLGGTDYAIGLASAGCRVMLLGAGVEERLIDRGWIGETVTLRAYGGPGDLSGQAVLTTPEVSPLLPLAPGHVRALRDGEDIQLSWTRRSRADAGGWGMGDAPLEHAPEAYRVSITAAGTALRSTDCSAPTLTYTAAEQIADFGGLAPAFEFTIAQISPVFGPGHTAAGVFDD